MENQPAKKVDNETETVFMYGLHRSLKVQLLNSRYLLWTSIRLYRGYIGDNGK